MSLYLHREITCDFGGEGSFLCPNTYDGSSGMNATETRREARKARGWVRRDGKDFCRTHAAPVSAEALNAPAPASPAGSGDTATEEREDAEDRAAADAIVPGRFGCVLVGIKPEWTPGDKAVWRIDADAPGEPVEVVKVVGTTALVASGDHRYTVDTAELSPPALPADTAHERTEP